MFKGLTSNVLKIIAIIAMVVDHIGYYYAFVFNNEIYTTLRIIGRISMPIFVFLLAEGYFHTKDLKKYLVRVFSFAVLTQAIISILELINCLYANTYVPSGVFELNILFSFTLSLIILYALDQICTKIKSRIVEKKVTNIYRLLIYFFIILACIFIYLYIPIDYGILIPILTAILYTFRKMLVKSSTKIEAANMNEYKAIVSAVIAIAGIISGGLSIFMILSLVFICLYNGKLGKNSSVIKGIFYVIFPLQHFILYASALVYYKFYIM